MKVLDSSVLIALFRTGETLHEKAVRLFMGKEDFLVMDYVLGEVITVLKLRESFEVSKKCLEFLTSVEGIKIVETDSETFWSAIDFFSENKNKLSFIDTLLFLFSKEHDLQLITFDKDLKKALR